MMNIVEIARQQPSTRPAMINVATDFTRYPGGRYRQDGDFSGEEFRDDVLVPALRKARATSTRVVVVLDGATGYPSSFLEEAFGGLVRERLFSAGDLKALLEVRAGPLYESYRVLAERYIASAKPKRD